jgi:hypothetical protein
LEFVRTAVPAFFEQAPGHQQSAIDKAGLFSCPVGRKRFRPPMSAKPTMLYTLTDEAPALVRPATPPRPQPEKTPPENKNRH